MKTQVVVAVFLAVVCATAAFAGTVETPWRSPSPEEVAAGWGWAPPEFEMHGMPARLIKTGTGAVQIRVCALDPPPIIIDGVSIPQYPPPGVERCAPPQPGHTITLRSWCARLAALDTPSTPAPKLAGTCGR